MKAAYDYEKNRKLLVDPENNRRLTAALFVETNVTPRIAPLFSLEEWGKTYVAIADPTDYRAAMHLLGNWEHWKMIVDNQTISPYVEGWREEVRTKLRSEAIASIRALAKTKDSAAKALYDIDRPTKPRGRPVKEKEVVPDLSSAMADAKRLGFE